MNAFIKGIVLGLLAGFLLAYGISSFYGPDAPVKAPQTNPAEVSVPLDEHLSVKGENTLLKKMLGQVEGQIILLGPVGKQSNVQGKLVWDNAMQQGFLHVGGLAQGQNYELLIQTKSGTELVVAEHRLLPDASDHWQTQFRPKARVLDLSEVAIRVITDGNNKMVLARGKLSEN